MRRSRFAAGTRLAFALLNGDESTPLVPRSLRFPKMFTAVVHSPVRLFGVSDVEAIGKVYSFTLSGVLRDGRPSYHYAETRMKTPSLEK